ncbi:MAG: hypothetical protein M3277_01020 [Actinomycetota bacterium]|nr:hypothetical protein [Actinomycetota bacterium]
MADLLFADRSDRGKLRLTGPQRAWFLEQILTNTFEDLTPGGSRDAALLTAHGRMVGYMETVATDDSLLMHFEPELKETLPEAIGRYVLATDVEIGDVSDDRALILIAGDGWEQIAANLGVQTIPHPTRSLGIPAGYVWVARDKIVGVVAAVKDCGARAAEESELEAIRIENAVPRWGREMDDKTFPQEVAIDEDAVHYDKGCYVGQEAMAKIHLRGKVNRRLRALESPEPLAPGTELFSDGDQVGIVTSSADNKALGMLRYTIYPGDLVTAGDLDVKVR